MTLEIKYRPSSGASPLKQELQFPLSRRLGKDHSFLLGRSMLLGVDSSAPYEEAVRDFAVEMTSDGQSLTVLTTRGSPVHDALLGMQNVTLYLMTSKVSYPKDEGQSNVMLVPQNDSAILLDLIDKAIASGGERGRAFVIDNLSNLLASWGLESFYKFMMEAHERISETNSTCMYIVIIGAQDQRIMNLIKSLFSNHLVCDLMGIGVARRSSMARRIWRQE